MGHRILSLLKSYRSRIKSQIEVLMRFQCIVLFVEDTDQLTNDGDAEYDTCDVCD